MIVLHCIDPLNSPFTAIFKRFKAAWGGVIRQYWKLCLALKPSMKQLVERRSYWQIRDD